MKQTLLNVFVRKFRPWKDMPQVLYDLKQRTEAEGQNVHIHYLTDAPETISSAYTTQMLGHYPRGSFDFRPLNFTKTEEMFNARKYNIQRLMESFPQRRFISIGDTTNTMSRFPDDMKDFYPRIQCLLVRDVSATERSDWVIPNTRSYLDLDDNEYLFFRTPADLLRLSGKHLASLVPQSDKVPRTFGCFDTERKLVQAMQPSRSRWNKIKSYARASWWNIKCAAILPMWRPNVKCPFDRIPGEQYYDGTIEPEVQLVPYFDNLPFEEFSGRSSEPLEPEEITGDPEEPVEPEDCECSDEEDCECSDEEDPEGSDDEDPEDCECSDGDDDCECSDDDDDCGCSDEDDEEDDDEE
jgi:hypothetical protein